MSEGSDIRFYPTSEILKNRFWYKLKLISELCHRLLFFFDIEDFFIDLEYPVYISLFAEIVSGYEGVFLHGVVQFAVGEYLHNAVYIFFLVVNVNPL